jgi:hypothetical protein
MSIIKGKITKHKKEVGAGSYQPREKDLENL